VLFKGLQSVHRYQILQQRRDAVCVRLVAREGCRREEVEAEVRRELERATRGLLAIEFEWLDDIPLSGAGKRRLVISDISRDEFGASAPLP